MPLIHCDYYWCWKKRGHPSRVGAGVGGWGGGDGGDRGYPAPPLFSRSGYTALHTDAKEIRLKYFFPGPWEKDVLGLPS